MTSNRTLTQNLRDEYSFAVEALEPRNMLTIFVWPVPSPVDLNPCDPSPFGPSNFNGGGSPLTGGPASSGSASLSDSGVRFSDGAFAVTSEFFQSAAFDQDLSISAVWTPYSTLASGDNGGNISNLSIPILKQADPELLFDRFAIISGGSIRWFELNFAGDYNSMFFGGDTLALNSTTHEFTYIDSSGTRLVFFDFTQANRGGEIKSMTSPSGITTNYFYHTGGSLDGKIDYFERSGSFNGVTKTERFDFVSYDAGGRVTQIDWQNWNGTSWLTNRFVEFQYYVGTTDPNGNDGDLKLATVKDSISATIDTTYYRYHKSGTSASLLKYILRPASYDRMVGASLDPLTAADAVVAPYADMYLNYDSGGRVITMIVQGEGCSSCSGGLGTYAYSYVGGRPDNDAFANAFNRWRYKTTETLPDGTSQNVVYGNEFGEAMLNVFDDIHPTNLWRSYTRYDDAGRIILQSDPVAITGFSESKDDLVDFANPDPTMNYISDAAGLLVSHVYVTTGTLMLGYFTSTSIKNGELDATPDLQYALGYTHRTDGTLKVNYVDTEIVYRGAAGATPLTTNYVYAYHGLSIAPKEITVTYPTVATAQNGSNVGNTESYVYNTFGDLIWTRDGDNFVNYIEYDLVSGGITKIIEDVNSYTGLPQAPGWTLISGGKHLTSTFEVDVFGRTTKSTDPNGNINYTVYRDSLHEVRFYGGWNSITNTATLPTSVQRFDRASGYFESIVMSAVPTVSAGRPTGTEAIASIQNWSRGQTNIAGQLIQDDAYFNLSGLTYSTSAIIGTEGTNFLRARYSYDNRGRLNRVQDSTGTIRRSVYDGLGRASSQWIGTDDTPTTGFWAPDNIAGTNLQNTHGYTYDTGGVGDSNLTEMIVQAGANAYSTRYVYDFRNRVTVARGPDNVATAYAYSNLDEVTLADVFADLDLDLALDANELRGRTVASYDNRMRAFQYSNYEVDPVTAVASDRLTNKLWYDARGNLVKTLSPSGLISKTIYDRLGRPETSFLSIDANAAELVYGAALTATGDTVIEQSTTIYDPGSRPVSLLSYQRLENDTASTGLLTPGNSYRKAAITWYDRADRITHATTFGRDDGTTRYVFSTGNTIIDSDADGIPNEAEGSPRVVNGSNDWITSEVQYDVAGRAYRSIDNLGRIGQTQFDALNRPTASIANFIDGTSTPTELASDQLTAYVYDSAGRPVEIHNWNAMGSTLQHQYTRNLFESLVDASWVTSVIYPDSSDTTSAGTDQVKYFYDALGRTTEMIDQRGVNHRYDYDSKGRFFKDRIINAIAGVDLSIRRIELTFDDISRVKKVTSFDAGSAGNVVNDVEYAYNGYGLISQTKQAHNGVTGPTTPAINYIYNDGAVGGESKFVRLTSVAYPAGEDTHYIYPTTGIGNALSRIEAISDTAAALPAARFAQYQYLGVDTIVTITHPAITGGLKLSYGAAGTYAGWDRFGRIVNQQWTNDAGTTTRDRTQYTYDRNSNRLTRSNPQLTTLSEVYTFDGLDRLTSLTRTGLNKTWVLDSTGNWNSLAITTTGTVTESRTHNAANEVLTVCAQTAPIHDAAGNITQAAKPNTPAANQVYVYDGWNRLVQVKETNGTVIATYEYDGRGNRIQKTTGATVRDYFHNDGGQVVEIRVNNILNQTFVWDLSYVDSPVMTRRDTASDGTLDQSYYFTFDALRNVTALINASNGNVLERYHYDAYGKVQVYNSTWTPLSASAYGNIVTFTGRELDTETGLYYFRARYFDPSLGRFLARDPLGYVDGMNLYEGYFVPGGVDPSGMIVIDELDDLKRRITELAEEKKNLPNRWPGDDDEIIKLRKATEAEIDGDIAEIQKRLRILNDSAKVADEHKRLRGDAHKDPLGAQESFDHAKSKGKVPEFYDSTKTDDLAKHHLAEQSRKGGRFVKKLKAMLPGPLGVLIGGYFFPGDAEAKGLGGATANEAFDSVPILEWIKPPMEFFTGEDWFPDEGQKGAFDEGGCLGPDYWDKWHNKRNNPGKLTPWEPKQ